MPLDLLPLVMILVLDDGELFLLRVDVERNFLLFLLPLEVAVLVIVYVDRRLDARLPLIFDSDELEPGVILLGADESDLVPRVEVLRGEDPVLEELLVDELTLDLLLDLELVEFFGVGAYRQVCFFDSVVPVDLYSQVVDGGSKVQENVLSVDVDSPLALPAVDEVLRLEAHIPVVLLLDELEVYPLRWFVLRLVHPDADLHLFFDLEGQILGLPRRALHLHVVVDVALLVVADDNVVEVLHDILDSEVEVAEFGVLESVHMILEHPVLEVLVVLALEIKSSVETSDFESVAVALVWRSDKKRMSEKKIFFFLMNQKLEIVSFDPSYLEFNEVDEWVDEAGMKTHFCAALLRGEKKSYSFVFDSSNQMFLELLLVKLVDPETLDGASEEFLHDLFRIGGLEGAGYNR